MAPEVGATPSDGVRGSKDRIVEPHVVGRPVPMPPGALFEAEQRKVHTGGNPESAVADGLVDAPPGTA